MPLLRGTLLPSSSRYPHQTRSRSQALSSARPALQMCLVWQDLQALSGRDHQQGSEPAYGGLSGFDVWIGFELLGNESSTWSTRSRCKQDNGLARCSGGGRGAKKTQTPGRKGADLGGRRDGFWGKRAKSGGGLRSR